MLKAYPGSFTPKISPRLLARYNIQDYSCKPLLPNKRLHRKDKDPEKEHIRKTRMYEESLRQSYNVVKGSLSSYSERKVDLRLKSLDVKQEKKQILSEIESLRKQAREEDKARRKTLRTNEELLAFSRKKTKRKTQLDQKMVDLNARISELNKTQTEIYEEMEGLQDTIKACKAELKRIKDIQVDHFKQLLKEGQDTRTEGLAWLVQSLWTLGETVDRSCYPSFLDDNSVQVIEYISQKQIEKDKLSKELAKMNQFRTIKKVTSSRDLMRTVKQRISTASQKVFAQDFTGTKREFTQKDLFVSFDKSGSQLLKEEINAIEDLVRTAKENEVYRITAECTLHFYEKKYKVTLKQLISTIIGAESLQRHAAGINRIRNNLEAQIASTRTFSFSSLA